MTDTPLSDFYLNVACGHVHDVAVLFALLGAEERARHCVCPFVSPAAKSGKVLLLQGISDEDLVKSFDRLQAAGEIKWNETEKWRGWTVTRFDELYAGLEDVGRRAYFRKKAKQSRESKGVNP